MGNCADGVQHRLLMSIDGFCFRTVYVNTKNQIADYISRNPAAPEPEDDKALMIKSPSLSDIGEDEDLLLWGPEKQTEDFLTKYEKRQEKVKSIAQVCWDVKSFEKDFEKTHIFSAVERSVDFGAAAQLENEEIEEQILTCKALCNSDKGDESLNSTGQ